MAPSGSGRKEEEKHGSKYSVAGGPGGISCTNRQNTQGVSIHNFPDPKKPKLYQKLVNFVRRHRPDFDS